MQEKSINTGGDHVSHEHMDEMEATRINHVALGIHTLEPGGIIGDYRLEKRIAGGGMGTVFQATQISMNRAVALKILHRSLSENDIYMERFFREVRTLASLEHTNLVHAIESGMDNGIAYFSMEYVKGLDLKRQIDLEHFFTEQEAFQIARDVAKALAHAWNKARLVHRDVKPANIIVTDNKTVKLLDLGISRQAYNVNNDITGQGVMIGSPTYISPEQARSEIDIDFRADIYSLGITLYHILAGQPPYDSHNSVAVVSMHLASPIPEIKERRPDISKNGRDIIKKMMAKKKIDRHDSWENLIHELDEIIHSLEHPKKKQKQVSPPVQHKKKTKKPKTSGLFSEKMQTHRIIALSILLISIIMALYAVIKRGIQETEYKKHAIHIKKLIAMRDETDIKIRTRLIAALEHELISVQSDELRTEIENTLTHLKEQEQSKKEAYAKKIQSELERLKHRSRELENNNRLTEALALWTDYSRQGEYREDSYVSNEIINAIEYLNRRIDEQEYFGQ